MSVLIDSFQEITDTAISRVHYGSNSRNQILSDRRAPFSPWPLHAGALRGSGCVRISAWPFLR